MFSSAVRYVPHGVSPPAQLPNVPSARTPSGSACVRSNAAPRAGPPISIGVSAVMRRLKARVLHELPATAHARDLDDRHTLRGFGDGHDLRMLFRRSRDWRHADAPNMPGCCGNISSSSRVFVVHAQDAALAARVERKEMDGVAIRAELALLPLGGGRLQQHARVELGCVEVRHRRAQTVAPAHQHVMR